MKALTIHWYCYYEAPVTMCFILQNGNVAQMMM